MQLFFLLESSGIINIKKMTVKIKRQIIFNIKVEYLKAMVYFKVLGYQITKYVKTQISGFSFLIESI